MNRVFYQSLCAFGRGPVLSAGAPLIAGREHLPAGGFVLAANHRSVFDPMVIMVSTWRIIRWVAAAELRTSRWQWFHRLIGSIPVRRDGRDVSAARRIVRMLHAGEMVGLFPEGGLRTGADAVTAGGPLNDGLFRLAEMAGVPLIPCAVAGAEGYGRWTGWLPFRRTRWAVIFGAPVLPGPEANARLREAMIALYHIAAAHVAGES